MKRQDRDLERWLAAEVKERPLAVVLGTSWNALSFARSLGRRRVPVLMLESKRSLGSYTRYGEVLALPPVDEDPEAWISMLQFVGARLEEPGMLVPTGDPHTLLIARRERFLRRYFRFLIPAAETVERIVNKRLQYTLAQEAGIPIPATRFPRSSAEVRELSAELSFPSLLKPYESHAGRKILGQKVLVARSANELVSGYERLAARGVPAMIQQIIPGDDRALFNYTAFWDDAGREVAWLTKQKLRQNPPGFGDATLMITAEAPEVADLSRRLLHAFDYRGFGHVEFKLHPANGTYYLIEVNPRVPAGDQLAISAGVDFPWIAYRYLTGWDGDREFTQTFQPGVKYVNEELDVLAYLALRDTNSITFRQWVRSIRGTKAWAIAARDDPKPALVGLWRHRRSIRLAASDVVPGRHRVKRRS